MQHAILVKPLFGDMQVDTIASCAPRSLYQLQRCRGVAGVWCETVVWGLDGEEPVWSLCLPGGDVLSFVTVVVDVLYPVRTLLPDSVPWYSLRGIQTRHWAFFVILTLVTSDAACFLYRILHNKWSQKPQLLLSHSFLGNEAKHFTDRRGSNSKYGRRTKCGSSVIENILQRHGQFPWSKFFK